MNVDMNFKLEDDDHEKFWFHYPKDCFDEILGKAKLIKGE